MTATRSGLSFVKMEGLGNDFVVVDLRHQPSAAWLDDSAAIARLCDRHFGIGADGVLAILRPQPGVAAAARMRVRNADGSEAEMCGNGLRCVAKYLFDEEPARAPALDIETAAGVLRCELISSGAPGASGESVLEVAMGMPRLEHLDDKLLIDGEELHLTTVSMGNPHAVIFAAPGVHGPALRALAESLGPKVEKHPCFRGGTNVEFVHRRSSDEYEVVVWERGCGITLACGTGACAVAVAACRRCLSVEDHWLSMALLGGPLQVRVLPAELNVLMRGPARAVFSGRLP